MARSWRPFGLARQKPFDCEELNRADRHEYVELKRTNESTTILQVVWRTLPRNGGRALLLRCPYCETPRRHIYGWEWDSWSDGRTEFEVSLGDADHAPGCATPPKAAICAEAGVVRWPPYFAHTETCRALTCGFRLCSRRRKRRQKRVSVNCHPSVGTGNGETLKAAVDRAPESRARKGMALLRLSCGTLSNRVRQHSASKVVDTTL
jgi:hypothetical protein